MDQRLFKLERRHQPLLSRAAFAWRLVGAFAGATGLISFSLLIGMVGYHSFESMDWVDAFVNAAMILSGMGPMSPLQSTGGKIFAGCYALYSGLALILAVSLILAPVVHRMLHRFHIETKSRP